MPFCAYAEGSAMMGATAVSNLFMLEYMPSAPGDYVKVYLYALLLCRCPELCSGVDAMAEALNLDAETGEITALTAAMAELEKNSEGSR